MIVRRPSSHLTISSASTSSAKSSLKSPSAFTEDWDADDEDAMSDLSSSRPLSVVIPTMGAHGPYCPRRPNLREILANTSPAPWTLAAFMAYLSNNLCLETLEFTMDAGRYRKHYAKMMSRASEGGLPPTKDREYVQALWQRLVEAYIKPSGSREVNLPSDVRDPILNLRPSTMPPAPEKLDPAVAKICELMEESVLVPFLNSVYPQSTHLSVQSCPYDTSDDSISASHHYEDRSSRYSRRSRNARTPPPISAFQVHANSYSHRQSTASSLSAPPHRTRFSARLSATTSSPSTVRDSTGSDMALSGPGLTTDDSGSTGSPTNASPTTPPMSPPLSDAQSVKRDSGMWKKLSKLSGMKVGKRKSHGGLNPEEA